MGPRTLRRAQHPWPTGQWVTEWIVKEISVIRVLVGFYLYQLQQ